MALDSPNQRDKRDPFAVAPLPKAYYHPTQQKHLSHSQKQISLSPNRVESRNKKHEDLTTADKDFLRVTNTFSTRGQVSYGDEHNMTSSSNFDESWPSSERPSSVSMLEEQVPVTRKQRDVVTDRFSDIKKTLEFPERDLTTTTPSKPSRPTEGGSVLGKYIERFRKGAPMSREERHRKLSADKQDFWWLSDSRGPERYKPHDGEISPKHKNSHKYTPHSSIAPYTPPSKHHSSHLLPVSQSPLDIQTKQLQEKADRLLEKSVSSVTSTVDPEVSTDGLGSSPGDTTVSSFNEKPYRPAFVRQLDEEEAPRLNIGMAISKLTKPSCPEDDILYQWRLRRKIDTARETTAMLTGTPNAYVPKSQQMSDGDKKLEEFKQRLALGADRFESLQQKNSGSVHFTPAPDSVPQHQFVSDQVEVDGAKLRHRDISPDRVKINQPRPPIASPILKKTGENLNEEDVQPHLHLMCDLLPCPHQREYVKDYELSKKGNGSRDYGNVQRESDAINLGKDQNGKYESENIYSGKNKHKDNIDNISNYRYLRAERPDIEVVSSGSDEKVSFKRDKSVDLSRQENTNKSDMPKVKKDVKGYDISESERYKVPKPVKKLSPGSRAESQNRFAVTEDKDYRQTSDRIHRTTSNRTSRQQEPEMYDSLNEGNSLFDQSVSDVSRLKGDNSTVPVPRQSDSPVMGRSQAVHSAIGQVIKDHLFDISTSTVISSMDSLPSAPPGGKPQQRLQNTEEQNRRQKNQEHRQNIGEQSRTPREKYPVQQNRRGSRRTDTHAAVMETSGGEDDVYVSDGEFEGDQLLQILRQQRKNYEEQLRCIDQMLEQMTPGTIQK